MKKILVIGGSSGIGGSAVRLLTKDHHEVFFTYHHKKQNAKKIEVETGAKSLHYDQNSKASIAQLSDFIQKENFDGLVLSAATPPCRETFINMNPQDIVHYLSDGIRGCIILTQAFAKTIRNNKTHGSIVYVLSSYVLNMPPEKLSSYVMLKYLLLGTCKVQAVEFAKYNVRVNSVSPSMTQTNFISDLPERFIQIMEEKLPMKRIATPDEVASVIKFLISAESGYVSGANIPVTGGSVC